MFITILHLSTVESDAENKVSKVDPTRCGLELISRLNWSFLHLLCIILHCIVIWQDVKCNSKCIWDPIYLLFTWEEGSLINFLFKLHTLSCKPHFKSNVANKILKFELLSLYYFKLIII